MSVRNLDSIFRPQRIAVVGATDRPGAVGSAAFRNLIGGGFNGVIYPINPKRESVQGIQAYPSLRDAPRTPDLAVVCTPGPTVPGVIRECSEAGVKGVVVISAGFGEVGEDGRKLQRQVQEELRRSEGVRLIGPNCLGIIVPDWGLNATFAQSMPKSGRVAFISQSGALCTSILDWAIQEDIGFSYFVSIGNMVDVDFGDLIDYFSNDGRTDSIMLYIESVKSARKFMSAARAFTRAKPIVAYKAGRYAESAAAAASHTGSMAGADVVYEAAFQRAGVERVFSMPDMFACAELLARHRLPQGPRLAIITNAGGPGVMATDALLAQNGELAPLSSETIEKLNQHLPPFWSHNNPIDVLGDAPPDRIGQAMKIAMADPNVDAALVILTPQAMTDVDGAAEAVAAASKHSRKPVLAAWMGAQAMARGIRTLFDAGVPTYLTAEEAIQAFMHLVSSARNLEILYETPKELAVAQIPEAAKQRIEPDAEREFLTERRSKELLAAYGIPVTQPEVAHSVDDAVTIADRMSYPVVLKILSPEITHKTDVGGVALNLSGAESVREAWDRIMNSVQEKAPGATVEGVTVQPMVSAAKGVEMILGARKDPTFGAAIMVGKGGIMAELIKDRAVGLPPLNERLARRLVESLRTWPLLKGYRGRPGMNIEKLVETITRFSYFIADHPEILEVDVNPLLVTAEGVMALDARIKIDPGVEGREIRQYEHLAIRPYPEQYIREATIRDGSVVTLRPIKPEDEPLWHDMLANCSAESLWFRFRAIFKGTTHKMASRYCYLDYDREMAIVAETRVDGKPKLLGVVRLVADPDHETAEYAVLVVDEWQNRGLGSTLTDYCLEIAGNWGVKEIIAETSPDNDRMIRIFKARDFELEHRRDEHVTLARKSLAMSAVAV